MSRDRDTVTVGDSRARIAMFLLLITAIGCHTQKANQPQNQSESVPQAKISVGVVTPANMQRAIEVPGTIVGYEQAKLMARIEGYVARVEVDIGDEVNRGQLLAVLDVPELAAEVDRQRRLVDKANADIQSRKAEVESTIAMLAEQEALRGLRQTQLTRVRNLVESNALKRDQLDEAQYALKSVDAAIQRCHSDIVTAEAHVSSAVAEFGVVKADLHKSEVIAAYAKIVAPFDGLIMSREVDPGAFVRPAGGSGEATPMFEIASTQKMRLVAFIPMEDAAFVDNGDEVTVNRIQGLRGETRTGTIARHSNAFHRNSRMMRAEIDLDNPIAPESRKRALKPGDYAMVKIVLRVFPDIPSVPLSAIGQPDTKPYVLVIDESNTIQQRFVDVVIKKDSIAGISGDVKPGDRVVVKDLERFTSGEKVPSDALALVGTNELQ